MNDKTHHNLASIISKRDPSRPARLAGMVHVGALPGTPASSQPIEQIEQQAVEEAKQLEEAGFEVRIGSGYRDDVDDGKDRVLNLVATVA